MRLVMLVVVLVASSCVFLDHDGPPPTQCLAKTPAAPSFVDPSTLACRSFPTTTCDPTCGPCPAIAQPAPPSWGSCTSSCRSIVTEVACAAAPGCRVTHDLAKHDANVPDFMGCYPVDMLPAPSVPCAGLDAWNCSRHDACSAYYAANNTTVPASWLFQRCIDELQPPPL